jgi:hypothetical protein
MFLKFSNISFIFNLHSNNQSSSRQLPENARYMQRHTGQKVEPVSMLPVGQQLGVANRNIWRYSTVGYGPCGFPLIFGHFSVSCSKGINSILVHFPGSAGIHLDISSAFPLKGQSNEIFYSRFFMKRLILVSRDMPKSDL